MGSDETLKAELERTVAECERLREENARLRLRVGEAPARRAPVAIQLPTRDARKAGASATVTVGSHPEVKVALFRSLFRGREDVYAVRWEGKVARRVIRPLGSETGSSRLSRKLARRDRFASESSLP